MGDHLTTLDIVLRLSAAIGCGAALGYDREEKHKPAGFRTYMLVALGAACFTLVTLELFYGTMALGQSIPVDPTRMVQGIVGGIGFLGAGAIIQARDGIVKGIKTAAGIWLMGALGVACGAGYFVIAGIATGFAFLIFHAVGALEARIDGQSGGKK